MSELHEYKQKFQIKVDEVKEQCDNTINKLTIENIELRWVSVVMTHTDVNTLQEETFKENWGIIRCKNVRG